MNKFEKVFYNGVAVIGLVFIGYMLGTLNGESRTVNTATAYAWARGHDSGCDEINARRNFYTGKMDLVCEVQLQSEDEEIYIIKGEGSYDDYK